LGNGTIDPEIRGLGREDGKAVLTNGLGMILGLTREQLV